MSPRHLSPILLCLLSLPACRRVEPPLAAQGAPAVRAAPVAPAAPIAPAPPAGPRTPRSLTELPTTDGATAVGNLDAAIRGQERALAPRLHPIHVGALIDLYLQRAQFLGRIEDYDRALALAERFLRENPTSGRAYLLRGRARAALHLFPQVEADLRAGLAQRQDPISPAQAEELRAGLLLAGGRLDEALALAEQQARARPDVLTVGMEAALRGERGELERPQELFSRALDLFPDVTPFPVVWIFLQEGLLWERAGRPGRARELYAAAHERLPAYAPAASHLAAMEAATGDRRRAIELLRPLLGTSDDPEYAGQLAALLEAQGEREEAARLRAQAAARYEALLRRHPEAFASHAARFFLGPGGDARRALALAERHLRTMQDGGAHELLVEAAAALGPPRACEIAAREERAPRASARLHVLLARALLACGQAEGARRHVAAAAAPPAR